MLYAAIRLSLLLSLDSKTEVMRLSSDQKDVERLLNELEKLKDKVRDNGNSH